MMGEDFEQRVSEALEELALELGEEKTEVWIVMCNDEDGDTYPTAVFLNRDSAASFAKVFNEQGGNEYFYVFDDSLEIEDEDGDDEEG